MSDLSIYELEDMIWDEFGQSDDHIVPHSSDKNANEQAAQVESHKKRRFEVVGISSNADDKYATKCVSLETEERDFRTIDTPNNAMLEKDSWSQDHEHMFSGSCHSDPNKELTNLGSENTSMSSHCLKNNNIDLLSGLCSDELSLSGRSTAVESTSYNYPLTHVSQTENEFHFMDNAHEDNESSDLLYYNWPDIGNFEDVDRMFRSCDSSFGLGTTGNEDDMGWFSASDAIEGSEDVSKSNFNLSCPDSNASRNLSEDLEPSKLKTESSSNDDLEMRSVSVSYKTRNSPAGDTSHKGYTSIGGQHQKQNLGPVFFDYLHSNNIPYMQLDYQQCSDQTTESTELSGNKSDKNARTCLPQKESSHASNGAQPTETSDSFSIDKMRGKLHYQQGFQRSFSSNLKLVDLGSICNPASLQTENEFENYGDIEGVQIEIPSELGPSNVPESLSINTALNKDSLEATSFCQLQQVTEQLDLRTKLCIRDSLYRLARSARQRHNYANKNGGPGDDRDAGTFMVEGTNKCTEFMDIETDTNPIDRSIAHLLFNRPSDSSVVPSPKALSLKSDSMIPGSIITSPPVTGQKLLCHEETSAETGKAVVDQ